MWGRRSLWVFVWVDFVLWLYIHRHFRFLFVEGFDIMIYCMGWDDGTGLGNKGGIARRIGASWMPLIILQCIKDSKTAS